MLHPGEQPHSPLPFWYGEKWWHEDCYRDRREGDPALTQIDRAIERVAELFDRKWWGGCVGHPALAWLTVIGAGPLEPLYELGRDLLEMDGATRMRSILRALKEADHYPGARFELQVAAILKRSGLAVEFSPPSRNRRKADLVARAGSEEVFFELKNLDSAQVQVAVDHLQEQMMFALAAVMSTKFLAGNKPTCTVELSAEALSTICGHPVRDLPLIRRYTTAVAEEMARRCNETLPVEFSVPPIANVRVGAPQDRYSGIMCPMLPPEYELKRTLRGCLPEAVEQLPELGPGLILIKTPAPLDPASATIAVTEWLLSLKSEISGMGAVIFMPSIPRSGGIDWLFPAFAIRNPRTTVAIEALQSYRILREAFEIAESPTPELGFSRPGK